MNEVTETYLYLHGFVLPLTSGNPGGVPVESANAPTQLCSLAELSGSRAIFDSAGVDGILHGTVRITNAGPRNSPGVQFRTKHNLEYSQRKSGTPARYTNLRKLQGQNAQIYPALKNCRALAYSGQFWGNCVAQSENFKLACRHAKLKAQVSVFEAETLPRAIFGGASSKVSCLPLNTNGAIWRTATIEALVPSGQKVLQVRLESVGEEDAVIPLPLLTLDRQLNICNNYWSLKMLVIGRHSTLHEVSQYIKVPHAVGSTK
ncbi:hypothetical protein K438DRAFT_1781309 [Mycena galopus ATCC 62051]|nr:hypothetical protein K438DRAFT_1781309 [Mycena galopus ATCC 62051]